MTCLLLKQEKIKKIVLHPSLTTQVVSIGAFGLIVTVAHNALHVHTSPLVMIFIQKLYFIPVILAGFWSGSMGGFAVALICALLYPHRGGFGMTDTPIFSAAQTTDIILLFIIGGITGGLRNLLNAELVHHRQTAEERDQALGEAHRNYEIARRSEHLAALGQMAAGIAHEVRNPLMGMQGAVDILRRSGENQLERTTALLDRLQKDIAHMDEITRHFLEFARPQQASK